MKIKYLILVVLSFLIISCGDDSSGSTDNLLTGTIRSVDFTYGSGRFGDFNTAQNTIFIRIDNAGPMVTDSCTTNSDDVYVVLKPVKETGRKELFYDNSTGEGIWVTFHHPDFFQNLNIESGGWYDIKSISDNELDIEFDIDQGDSNNLKGRCTVYNCN